mgnify:CR=1 FL=1
MQWRPLRETLNDDEAAQADLFPHRSVEFSVFSNLLFDIRTEALQNELMYRALELFGIHVECVGTRVIVRLCSRHSPAFLTFLVGNVVAGTALHRTPRGGDFVL